MRNRNKVQMKLPASGKKVQANEAMESNKEKQSQVFTAYMRNLRKAKHCRWNDIADEIGVKPKRIYKLISGEKRTRNRDLMILIGISLHETVEEMQEMLSLYGLPDLRENSRRDALLLKLLKEEVFEISQVNAYLEAQNEEPLKAYVRTNRSHDETEEE